MKKINLLLIAFLVAIAGFAQSKGNIVGHVVDANNLPIPGVVIKIESLNRTAITDFDGNYVFVGVNNGTYKLSSNCLGCEKTIKTIVIDGKSIDVDFLLNPALNELDEVVIKGSNSRGQAKALNKQKTNFNVTNIVAADQVGKFPDANIGDAVKRIPGITVQNDQGEARNIIIRGLAPQLNSVTLNGERIPSAEGDNRNVQLDLIPSDMVQAVEVNKVITPDMEGDAIGGSVNLVTRAAKKDRITLTAGYGHNPVRNTPVYNFAGILSTRFLDDKLGALVSTSIQRNEFGSDNVEFEWNTEGTKPVLVEHDIRRYDVTRQRQSVALNLDYKFNDNNKVFFNTVLNNRKDWENRYKLSYKDIEEVAPGVYETEIRRETKGGLNNDSRLEEQEIQKYALNGEHLLFNEIKVDWKANYSKASETRPNERYITYRNKGVEVTQDLSDVRFPLIRANGTDDNDPTAFELKEISEENQYTEEENLGFKIDVEIPVIKGGEFENTIKVGYRFKDKEKLRTNNYTEYEPTAGLENLSDVSYGDKTLNDFLAGDKYNSGNFVNREFLTSLNLTNTALFDSEAILEEFVPVNYNANEKVSAAYGMLTQKVGEHFSVLAGLRVEKTDIDYTGYRIDTETASSVADATKIRANKTYANWLPNLQLKYTFGNNNILRLAYSNAIARPNYYDLVPYQNLNSDDFEFAEGNSNLKATEATNLDLMFEHYLSSVGILSLGGFYKNLDNFIFTYREDGYVDAGYPGETFEYSQPRNGSQAIVYGVEASIQSKLDFMETDFLKNINVYLNYTYTASEADGVEGRGTVDLAGAVKNMFNTSVAYENEKLTVRTSLNYAGDYIDEYGGEASEDSYYDNQLFLDVNGSYEITKGLRIFAEAKNLTNQELRYYQGSKDLTKQAEFYGVNWNIGVKYNF